MQNPWKTFDPFKVMFQDHITITGRRPNNQSVSCDCIACVYPPATIEHFTEESEETRILKQKILVARNGELSCAFEPQVGDKIQTDEGAMYICDTFTLHEWYDIQARSKK